MPKGQSQSQTLNGGAEERYTSAMTSHDARTQALAAVLAALAGYVDASGFMATGGYFVSFMSGNSTRFGIGFAEGAAGGAVAAGLIVCFLIGVIVGALLGHAAQGRRRSAVLIAVALLLATSAALSASTFTPVTVAPMALAMGLINNVFDRNGEVSLGVTYMTGSLVKLGQRIAAALLGADRWSWIPYLVLWLGFVAGVVSGALAYPRIGLAGLWGVAVIAAALALGTWRRTGADRTGADRTGADRTGADRTGATTSSRIAGRDLLD